MNKLLLLKISFVILFFFAAFDNSFAQNEKMFTNPILAGFYPDPSICKVGDDYYLVNSTFSYFPGIPVFHSKDLINWKLIGHVLDRPEQLNLDGQGVSRGIFAPAIRYNDGVFYVTCTLVDIGGNFIVTSKSPGGPWSNPVWIPEINGIDPSMFFDIEDPDSIGNSKAYIIYNSIAPDDKPLYDGHRTIRMYEFDIKNLKVAGEEKILVNGGTDINKKPIWIEGPHIFKKDGYYYMIAAEGGTGDQHSEVVLRSKKVDGPYIPYENNPILTQRHLNSERKNPITSTGHTDFVETNEGEWWAVFLGCRPYEDDYYNTGRETFLAPVKWINEWPVINPDNEEVQFYYPYPVQATEKSSLKEKNPDKISYSGNFRSRDNFDNEKLNINWMFLRTPHTMWYDLTSREGFLTLQLRPETCSGNMNPSFLGHRQQHLNCSASAVIDFIPESENEKAGLVIFQNETHFYFLCKSLENNKSLIQLYKSAGENSDDQMELVTSREILEDQDKNELYLKIEANKEVYSFLYAFNPDDWILLEDNVDAKFLSTKTAGGFVGSIYAMYATSLGKPCENKAYFNWFEYKGNDEIYK